MNEAAMAAADTPVIACRGLRKTYRNGPLDVPVLLGIDLDVAVGERLAIVGASGSGKSTLLHLLGGLDLPTGGEVRVEGAALRDAVRGTTRGSCAIARSASSTSSITCCRSSPRWRTSRCRSRSGEWTRARRRASANDMLDARRARASRPPSAGRAFGRRAPACRTRARARDVAALRAGGRADRQSRSPQRERGVRPDARTQSGRRHGTHHRDARRGSRCEDRPHAAPRRRQAAVSAPAALRVVAEAAGRRAASPLNTPPVSGRASATGTTSRRCGRAANSRRLRATRRAWVAGRRSSAPLPLSAGRCRHGQHVGAQFVEHQEHLGRPAADALDVDERFDEGLVVERRPFARIEARRREMLREIADVFRLASATARMRAALRCACAARGPGRAVRAGPPSQAFSTRSQIVCAALTEICCPTIARASVVNGSPRRVAWRPGNSAISFASTRSRAASALDRIVPVGRLGHRGQDPSVAAGAPAIGRRRLPAPAAQRSAAGAVLSRQCEVGEFAAENGTLRRFFILGA